MDDYTLITYLTETYAVIDRQAHTSPTAQLVKWLIAGKIFDLGCDMSWQAQEDLEHERVKNNVDGWAVARRRAAIDG